MSNATPDPIPDTGVTISHVMSMLEILLEAGASMLTGGAASAAAIWMPKALGGLTVLAQLAQANHAAQAPAAAPVQPVLPPAAG